MKLNKMVCPRCGHEFWTDCAYGTCDACQTFFYASWGKGVVIPPRTDSLIGNVVAIRGDYFNA